MTVYNVGANQTPWINSRTGIDGSNPVTIETRDVDDIGTSAVCTSTPPFAPPFILWNNSIGDIHQTNTPKFRLLN